MAADDIYALPAWDEITTEQLLRVVVAAKLAIEPKDKPFEVTGIQRTIGASVRHPGSPSRIDVAPQWIEVLSDANWIRLQKETIRLPPVKMRDGKKGGPRSMKRWQFVVLPAAVKEVERLGRVEPVVVDTPNPVMDKRGLDQLRAQRLAFLRAVLRRYPRTGRRRGRVGGDRQRARPRRRAAPDGHRVPGGRRAS
jgi:hypothetical protein